MRTANNICIMIGRQKIKVIYLNRQLALKTYYISAIKQTLMVIKKKLNEHRIIIFKRFQLYLDFKI